MRVYRYKNVNMNCKAIVIYGIGLRLSIWYNFKSLYFRVMLKKQSTPFF